MAKSDANDLTWEEAVLAVLRGADSALHYSDIAERISSQKLKTKIGANPAATVAATLSRALESETSPFQRVGRGEYTLKDHVRPVDSPLAVAPATVEEESDTGALRAFGMFWQRSQVAWDGRPKLFGRQQVGASEVNFSSQIGVYLLHDRERVIYVGRATETLYDRLKMHTLDRLGGRWDRFSWFGLRRVDFDGNLSEPTVAWTHTVVIETLEALLIESLEPPLNRKRGDNFSGIEYLQVADPEIAKKTKKLLLQELIEKSL